MQQATVRFSGRVQGVGFRFTAVRCAERHGADDGALTGWVRNEPDGSVLMVVEGERAVIDACLDDLRQQMAGNIHNENVKWAEATGEFDTFGVRY